MWQPKHPANEQVAIRSLELVWFMILLFRSQVANNMNGCVIVVALAYGGGVIALFVEYAAHRADVCQLVMAVG